MINLNDFEYGDRKQLTKENLMDEVDPYSVFKYYTDCEFQLGKLFNSPLGEDKNPSFNIYYSKKHNNLLWHDFRYGSGDCIMLVSRVFGLNYYESLCKIATDFNISDKFREVKPVKKSLKKPIIYDKIDYNTEEKLLQFRSRNWNSNDLDWWLSYGVTERILNFFKVKPIDYIFLNSKIIKCDRLAYVYTEFKDNLTTYKMYQPMSKTLKWLSSHNSSVIQGWNQLPEKHSKVIITSSLKDAMSIVSTLKIPAIAPQAESTVFNDKVICELLSRFDNVYLLYDNDYDKTKNWGQINAEKILKANNRIKNLVIPSEYKSKDYSDLVKNKGTEFAIKTLNKIISNYE